MMLATVGEDLKRKHEDELLASDNLTEEERRRIKRRASNRESARRTRYKRTEKLKELEERKITISEENNKIISQIHELEKIYWDALMENRQLKSEIQAIRVAKPQISALCPPSMSTSYTPSQPVAADFLSMSLPLDGTVPPAMPLSLNSEVAAGMPHPQLHASMSDYSGLQAGAMLSMPPPLSTALGTGLHGADGGLQQLGMQPMGAEVRSINFTSMLEGVESEGSGLPSSSAHALAQFYATAGLQPQLAMQPQLGKDGALLSEAAPLLPDSTAGYGVPFVPAPLTLATPTLPMPTSEDMLHGLPKPELGHPHGLPPP